MRTILETIDRERRSMAYALYANGMIDSKGIARELQSINARADQQRIEVLHKAGVLSDEQVGADEFSDEPPMPTKVVDDGG